MCGRRQDLQEIQRRSQLYSGSSARFADDCGRSTGRLIILDRGFPMSQQPVSRPCANHEWPSTAVRVAVTSQERIGMRLSTYICKDPMTGEIRRRTTPRYSASVTSVLRNVCGEYERPNSAGTLNRDRAPCLIVQRGQPQDAIRVRRIVRRD